MLLPLAGLLVLIPTLGGAGIFVGGSVVRVLAALGVATILGGIVAGDALRQGWRGRLAFSVAFPLGAGVPLFAVTTLQALSGHESVIQLMVGLGGSFALSFAVMGAVGATLLGGGWRLTGRSALAFASAGALGGMVLVGVAQLPATADGGAWLRLIGSLVALLGSAAGGGWWLAGLSTSDRT